jgi:hypothetical protein
MMKLFKFVLIALFFLPLQAGAEAESNALVIKDGKARIITSYNNLAQCISPVHIQKIDGREVFVQPQGFDLAPGTHTLSGNALINTSYCQTVGQGTNRYHAEPIEAEFEAGKTYWVGINHKSPHRKNWKYVIWNVKD